MNWRWATNTVVKPDVQTSTLSGIVLPLEAKTVEEPELLPKHLLEYAQSGDRSSEWLEIAESDTASNHALQFGMGQGLMQNQQLSSALSNMAFSGSSFMSSAMMQQLNRQGGL